MNDRMRELARSAPPESETETDSEDSGSDHDRKGSDIEMGKLKNKHKDSDDDDQFSSADEGAGDVEKDNTNVQLKSFFHDVEEVKDAMDQIQVNMGKIKRLYAELLTATSTDQGRELNTQVNEVRDETNAIAQNMRRKLKTMRKENDEFEAKHSNDPSLCKIRTNMHGSLVRKFLDLMQEYQQLLTKYDQKIREKAYRQVQLVAPDADPADIDEVLEQGTDVTQGLFSKQIMEDRKLKNAKQTLDYLQEKQNDLHDLEKSIVELNQLFQDMAILVETQGDLIDQIEYSVLQSKAYTDTAVGNLHQTAKLVNSTRKKKIYILIIIGVVIVILVLFILIISGVLPPLITSL